MHKNRIPLILAGLVLLSSALSAEVNTIRFGIKGSLNISRHWSSEEISGTGYSVTSKNKTTLAWGGLMDIPITHRFHVQPEIYWVRKSSQQNIALADIPIGSVRANYSLDYIEIPILFKAYLKEKEQLLRMHIVTGPYLSFLVHDSYSFKNTFLGEQKSDIPGLRKSDYGMIFGAGLDVNGPGTRFVFGYRFSLGMANLSLPTGPGLPFVELRNQCHMLALDIIL